MLKNIIGFNITWFGLVYWGNAFIPIAMLMLSIHLLFFINNKKEIFYILLISVIGIGVDSLLHYFDLFIFNEEIHIPFWLMVLWPCFASTLSHSLRFLDKAVWLQIVAGLLAPLSYIAGYQFEAVNFSHSIMITYIILSLIWASLFMLFFKLQSFFIDKELSHD
jgi:hypothetical protein